MSRRRRIVRSVIFLSLLTAGAVASMAPTLIIHR